MGNEAQRQGQRYGGSKMVSKGKRQELAAVESRAIAIEPGRLSLASQLDFERASPSVALSALAFELRELAEGVPALADISVELNLSAESASLRFRAYSRKASIM